MKQPFEGDTFLADSIIQLIVDWHVRSVIETGTETGVTSNAFASMVPEVYTIDRERKFDHLHSNVRFMEGDTRFLLEEALCSATLPVLIYLDAHSGDLSVPCPIYDELSVIPYHVQDPIIVVHDAKVPDHPEFGWASYSNGDISLPAISHLIPPIYPQGFRATHNQEATGAKSGVLFIVPSLTSQTHHSTIPPYTSVRKTCSSPTSS